MSPGQPWLSVVMPTYNGAAYLAAALQSVRCQDPDGVEVIAVDDGSTDATPDILAQYSQAIPMRILRPGRIGNWVAATNLGLRTATGRYACFLHQDDLWLAGRLSALRAERAHSPGASLLVHPAVFVGPEGELLGRWRCPLPSRGGLVPSDLFVRRLLVQNFIAITSPVFDREVALQSGGMDESLWYTADWDLWLRLGRLGQVRYLPLSLAAFRVHPGAQTVARPSDSADRRRQLRTVLDRHLALLQGSGWDRRWVKPVAEFSAELNVTLASSIKGESVRWAPLLGQFLRLGPAGWARYFRYSRIRERVAARLRLRKAPTG